MRHMRQSISLADSLSNLMFSEIAQGHSSGNYEEQVAILEEEAAALRLELEECREGNKTLLKQLKDKVLQNSELKDKVEQLSKQSQRKVDFFISQQKLREQLRSLEISIQSKEKLIQELQESQMQTKEMASKCEIRAG